MAHCGTLRPEVPQRRPRQRHPIGVSGSSPWRRLVPVKPLREPLPLPLLPHPQPASLALNLVAQRDVLGQHVVAHAQPLGSPIGFVISHVTFINYAMKIICAVGHSIASPDHRRTADWLLLPAGNKPRAGATPRLAHVTRFGPFKGRRGCRRAMPRSCRSSAGEGKWVAELVISVVAPGRVGREWIRQGFHSWIFTPISGIKSIRICRLAWPANRRGRSPQQRHASRPDPRAPKHRGRPGPSTALQAFPVTVGLPEGDRSLRLSVV